MPVIDRYYFICQNVLGIAELFLRFFRDYCIVVLCVIKKKDKGDDLTKKLHILGFEEKLTSFLRRVSLISAVKV